MSEVARQSTEPQDDAEEVSGQVSEDPLTPPYTMRISRLTIDKLGIKLYDRVSAVLAELISNAYDADATEVTVTLPWDTYLANKTENGELEDCGYEIRVVDNGHGMTTDQVNEHYLKVGSDRRARMNSDKSLERGRPVMGRKGIGKLAPFGICRTIEVITAGRDADSDKNEQGWPVSHLILRLDKVLNDTDEDYHPEAGALDGTYSKSRGTQVILRDFERKRVNNRDELDRQLAARFGLSRKDWVVSVVNSLADDADPKETAEFVLGELKIDVMADTKIDLSNRPVEVAPAVYKPVSGFMAYSKQPYKDEAMAGIRILARGKLVAQTRDFGIAAGFTGEYKMRSYLVGVVHADWLDEHEDLVRSDRQDILWTSELGEALQKWGQNQIKDVASRSEDSVKKRVWEEFEEKSNLNARLLQMAPRNKGFRDSVLEAAKVLVSNKDREALSDEKHVESVVRLALSLGPHRGLLKALHEVSTGSHETTLQTIVDLFEQARISETFSLGQIAQERIAAIEELRKLIDNPMTLEDPFQQLIENAPWLLAPEWTPIGMNEPLKRVRKSFESWYEGKYGTKVVTSTIDCGRKEPDFVLLHDSGTLWIVEIKRMGYKLTDREFTNAYNYLVALKDFLKSNPEFGDEFLQTKLTFIVESTEKLSPANRRLFETDPEIEDHTWREILNRTEFVHRDFTDAVYTEIDIDQLGRFSE